MSVSAAVIRLACLAALFGFLFGFDEGIIAGALPFIAKLFAMSPAEEGLMTAAVPLGAVAGVVLAAMYSDSLGRKRVLFGCSIVFVIGSVASGFADGMPMLTVARLLLGLAIGASSIAAPMFLAELAPPSVRGAVVSAYQLMITIGILISYLVDLGLAPLGDWRLMLGLGAVPAIIALVGVILSPESPRWLVLKGRHDHAKDVVSTLQPHLDEREVHSAVHAIKTSLDKTPETAPWSAFLTPKMKPIVMFAVMLFVLQQLSGINAVIYYAPRILGEVGMEGIAAQLTATVGIGALNVVVTIVAMLVVDRMGRRPLLLIGFLGTSASLAFIAYSVATPTTSDSPLALVGLFTFIAFFALAIGPLPWLYMSELFPMRLKTRGMALAATANWSLNFAVVFLFPIVLSAIGGAATFSIFAAFCAFGFVYSYLKAPETKGVPLEDMEGGVPTSAPT